MAAAMIEQAHELLLNLIEEYPNLLATFPELQRLADSGDPDAQETKDSLAQVNPDSGNVYEDALQWWEQNGQPAADFERAQKVHYLLRRLETIFAERKPIRIRVGDKTLVLGRRWWAHVSKCQPNGPPITKRSAFSAEHPLRHLRAVPREDAELIDGCGHSARFHRAFEKRVLRIGLCPLFADARTHFAPTEPLDPEYGVYGFRATHVAHPLAADDGEYLASLAEAVKWAVEQKVHVLVLPELAVCQEGRDHLVSQIAEDPGELCIVIPGSFHQQDQNGDFVNRAPIWLVTNSGAVQEEIPFDKATAFSTAIGPLDGYGPAQALVSAAKEANCWELKEDIVTRNSIRVIRTPVGYMGVAICKDCLAAGELLNRYARTVDHLLIASMNPTATPDFWAQSDLLARTHSMASYYVNSSQFVEEDDATLDLAYWLVPSGVELEGKAKSTFFRYVAPNDPGERKANAKPWPKNAGGIQQMVAGVTFELRIPSQALPF